MEDKLKTLMLGAKERATSTTQASQEKHNQEREEAKQKARDAFERKLQTQLGSDLLLLLDPLYDATFHATGKGWLGIATFNYNDTGFELRESIMSSDLTLRKQGTTSEAKVPSGSENSSDAFLLALAKFVGI